MRKLKLFALLALGLLMLSSILGLLMPRNSVLPPTWSYKLPHDPYEVSARPQGGVAVALQDKVIWLTANGELEMERSIAPEVFHFPETIGGSIVSGTESGNVFAFSVDKGEILWKNKVFGSTCKVVKGQQDELWALLGTVQEGYTEVAVLDSEGTELRRFKLTGPNSAQLSGGFPTVSPAGMLIADTTVHNPTYDNAQVTAFDPQGKQLWSNQLGGHAIWDVKPLSEKTLCGVAHQKKVFCLDEMTGKEIWSYSNPRQTSSTPWSWHQIWNTPKEQLLVESEGWLYLLNSKGERIWEHGLGASEPSCLVELSGEVWSVVSKSTGSNRLTTLWWHLQSLLGSSVQLDNSYANLLLSVSPEGSRTHERPINFKVNLKSVGSEGELYGWCLVNETSYAHFLQRYDP